MDRQQIESATTTEFFNFDLGEFRDILYIFARRYTEPHYQMYHKFLNPKHRESISSQSKEDFRKDKKYNDCFGFIWVVLGDMVGAGYLKPIFSKNMGEIIPIIQNSVDKGTMREFTNIEFLKEKQAGLFLALKKSEKGWSVSGSRHMGFWFYFDDFFHLIHNLSRDGVKEQILSQEQFGKYLTSFYKVYL